MWFPSSSSTARPPCPRCGEAVVRSMADEHRCDPQRRVEFEMAALGAGVRAFDDDLSRYLAGAEGRFEAWLAERQVRRSA